MASYTSSVKFGDFSKDAQSFFKNRKVFVPGGSGFIGSHVVEQLIELGSEVRVPTRQDSPRFLGHLKSVEIVKCDLEKPDEVQSALKGYSAVLNLAASVAGIEYNKNHPASIFQDNLTVFFNLIRASEKAKVDRFLVTSSACVYPRHCSLPTPEIEGMKDEPEPTNSGYGWAKRMEEYLGQKYAEEYGLSVAIARPYNAYGPRDNFEPASSHVIPALIRKAFETNEDYFEVWGSGDHSRSFLFVDDFARGLIEVAARYPEADPLNIGADEEVTIRAVAELIAEKVSQIRGKKISPKFNPTGITGQPRRRCDTSKIEKILDYRARVSFEEGLDKTIVWYSNQRI